MIQFVEIDSQKIIDELLADMQSVLGYRLYPGDERYMFLQQQAQVIVGLKAEINRAANENLLRYASAAVLEEYGRQENVPRLQPKKAETLLRFSVSPGLSGALNIPAGTRATPDGMMNFLTDSDAVISAGETTIDIWAVAEAAGDEYNGLPIGAIVSIVDRIPGLSGVYNITESVGGADIEGLDAYRERIRASGEGLSTAGSEEGYAFWARAASQEVVDVKPVSDSDAVVTTYVLAKDTTQPPQELLEAVAKSLSARLRRPLTDDVRVMGAAQKKYNIIFTYYIDHADSEREADIRRAVPLAVEEFKSKLESRLGGCINPDTLRRGLLKAGGFRLDITEPVYTELLPQDVAVAENIEITYGGLL